MSSGMKGGFFMSDTLVQKIDDFAIAAGSALARQGEDISGLGNRIAAIEGQSVSTSGNLTAGISTNALVGAPDIPSLRRENVVSQQVLDRVVAGLGALEPPDVAALVTEAELLSALATSQAAESHGVDRRTGQILSGWEHVRQSMEVILTTRLGSRLLRRFFGAGIPALIDENGTTETLLTFRVAIAQALYDFEPRFEVSAIHVTRAENSGVFGLLIEGVYLPRGHLGDKSIRIDAAARIGLN